MKRILLFSSLFLMSILVFSAEKSTIIQDVLNEYVTQKVNSMQDFIHFSDSQADQLKVLELNFLLKVQKAENCKWCNSEKKMKKLKIQRINDMQKILTREQYLKYDALERDKIKKYPLRSVVK